MKNNLWIVLWLLVFCSHAQTPTNIKGETTRFLDEKSVQLYAWSDSLWKWSEPSFEEYKSAKLIKDVLKSEGFDVQTGLSGVETMFMASFGDGQPIVSILAEYDADSRLLRKDVPFELPDSQYGHGAGHNLLGIGSLGAALAIKKQMKEGKLRGTIRYVGSTAEGGIGGRAYLVRDGFFDDVDLAVYWHPSPVTSANMARWDAIVDLRVNISSNDEDLVQETLASWITQLQNLRNQETELTLRYKIHMQPIDVARASNKAEIIVRIEDEDQVDVNRVLKEIRSLNRPNESDVRVTCEVFRSVYEFIPSKSGNNLAERNMEYLGPLNFDAQDEQLKGGVFNHTRKEERPFMTRRIPFGPEAYTKTYYGYGSDIGDVSWKAPEIYFVVSCLPLGASMRNWEGSIFSGSMVGKKGMIYAAKVMALSVIDYLSAPSIRREIKKEFDSRRGEAVYLPLIPNGAPDKELNSKRSY